MSISPRSFKDEAYAHLARIGKALSAPKRLELLDLLSQGPRTVEVLANEAAMSTANTSRHLQVLYGARLVDATKHGLYVEYRLADEDVSHFFVALRSLAETHLSEVEQLSKQYFEERVAVEAVPNEELLRRVHDGEVTVLDVRPTREYEAGHIPGAVSVPVDELERRLGELPRDRTIVAYCRGPYCVMAAEAVEVLRARGFDALRMEHGVADWRARGWLVEANP